MNYYGDVDSNLEIKLDTLDDLFGEAGERAFVLTYTDDNRRQVDKAIFKFFVAQSYYNQDTNSRQQIYTIDFVVTIKNFISNNSQFSVDAKEYTDLQPEPERSRSISLDLARSDSFTRT